MCHSDYNEFFVVAFALAAKKGKVPQEFNVVAEVELLTALLSGNLSKIPDGYQIPGCVRSLTDEVLTKHHPESFFLELQVLRRLTRPTISPAA